MTTKKTMSVTVSKSGRVLISLPSMDDVIAIADNAMVNMSNNIWRTKDIAHRAEQARLMRVCDEIRLAIKKIQDGTAEREYAFSADYPS